ncbi:MAG: hypothetical protein IJZ08_03395 [Clostridia bacterium]|nr:hypothetical protein [Clostridia bacterium]
MNFVWRQLGQAFFGASASVGALFYFWEAALPPSRQHKQKEFENGRKGFNQK